MSKIWALLVAGWKIICFLNNRAKEKFQRKNSGFKNIQDGIKNEDISKITAGFDDINNA